MPISGDAKSSLQCSGRLESPESLTLNHTWISLVLTCSNTAHSFIIDLCHKGGLCSPISLFLPSLHAPIPFLYFFHLQCCAPTFVSHLSFQQYVYTVSYLLYEKPKNFIGLSHAFELISLRGMTMFICACYCTCADSAYLIIIGSLVSRQIHSPINKHCR